jgi:hypothetical protein
VVMKPLRDGSDTFLVDSVVVPRGKPDPPKIAFLLHAIDPR